VVVEDPVEEVSDEGFCWKTLGVLRGSVHPVDLAEVAVGALMLIVSLAAAVIDGHLYLDVVAPTPPTPSIQDLVYQSLYLYHGNL
jgi:hypothetical protein